MGISGNPLAVGGPVAFFRRRQKSNPKIESLKKIYEDVDGYALAFDYSEDDEINEDFLYGETPPETMENIIRDFHLDGHENFYDLGSGTGKALFAAAICGRFTRCVGVELSDSLYIASANIMEKAYKAGLFSDVDVEVIHDNFNDVDFSDADVVYTCYIPFSDRHNRNLMEIFNSLKPGTKVLKAILFKDLHHSPNFRFIGKKTYKYGWGHATVYTYLKVK